MRNAVLCPHFVHFFVGHERHSIFVRNEVAYNVPIMRQQRESLSRNRDFGPAVAHLFPSSMRGFYSGENFEHAI